MQHEKQSQHQQQHSSHSGARTGASSQEHVFRRLLLPRLGTPNRQPWHTVHGQLDCSPCRELLGPEPRRAGILLCSGAGARRERVGAGTHSASLCYSASPERFGAGTNRTGSEANSCEMGLCSDSEDPTRQWHRAQEGTAALSFPSRTISMCNGLEPRVDHQERPR